MGLDIWFCKLKDKEKWNMDCWLNKSDEVIDDYLEKVSKSNYYYDKGFENADIELKLMKLIEKEMNVSLDLDGDPIYNPEKFNELYYVFERWIKEKWGSRTVFDNPDKYYPIGEEQFKFDRVMDLFEYIKVAKENGFTLWFSW